MTSSVQGPQSGNQNYRNTKKDVNSNQCLLSLGLCTASALLALIVVILAKTSINSITQPSQPSENHMLHKQVIPSAIEFNRTCGIFVQTYTFQNGTVKWDGIFSYLTRGMSMHCFMARAAKRLGPDFSTTVRIGLADMDVGGSLTFQPAARMHEMASNANHNQTEDVPLLFPDSTFESWPEVYDFSLAQTMRTILDAAHSNGLPGTRRWEHRNPKVLWRGVPHGKERMEIIQSQSPLLDVQSTTYNMTRKGMRLSQSNRLSRSEHCSHRFLLHMNGIFNNRYSSSVKWKMLCGSLVFVPSNPVFVEWWNYDVWRRHKHYVPYSSLDDLLQQVEYYNNHLDEAAIIARNGMELVQFALDSLDDWVDDTLIRYAAASSGKDAVCRNYDSSGSKPLDQSASRFKSLEELQKEYGPTICA